jgi:hypothetical protein
LINGFGTSAINTNLSTNVIINVGLANEISIPFVHNWADGTAIGGNHGSVTIPNGATYKFVYDPNSNTPATSFTWQQMVTTTTEADLAAAWTPYNGGESVTLPNGLIMKFGTKSVGADGTAAVSFATAFPRGIAQVQLTFQTTIHLGTDAGVSASSQLVTGFTIQNGSNNTETVAWMAIGY